MPEDSIFTDITALDNPVLQMERILKSIQIRYSDTLKQEAINHA